MPKTEPVLLRATSWQDMLILLLTAIHPILIVGLFVFTILRPVEIRYRRFVVLVGLVVFADTIIDIRDTRLREQAILHASRDYPTLRWDAYVLKLDGRISWSEYRGFQRRLRYRRVLTRALSAP